MLSSVSAVVPAFGGTHTPTRNGGDTRPLSETSNSSPAATPRDALSLEELKTVQQLQARDQEVRTHEQAHLSAAGGIAVGGASFTYATGPDGKRYAVGGEVSIDTSEIAGDPQASLKKAELIRRAALAPANPSGQDLRVAGRATAMANQARLELLRQQANGEQSESRPGAQLDLLA